MEQKNVKNCWEYWNCDMEVRKNCPAYTTDSGDECWFVAGSWNENPTCPKIKNQFKNCFECPWFKMHNKISTEDAK